MSWKTVAAGLVIVGALTCDAKAQPSPNLGQLISGLINVNVNVQDITVEDVIDVEDVLNNNEVRVLNNVLNNSPILSNNSDILTNLLREADILNDLQVVVGVLSGAPVVLNLP